MKPGSRSRSQRFVSLLAAAAVALAPWQAAAQTFSGATEVVVVEVPVQVIRDGEPVRGLTAADFELFDGRKKVEITGFEVLDLNVAETSKANADVPVAARRHFMMLFDLSNSEPRAIAKARDAAKNVVDSLHPTDLVSVATYSTLQGPQLVIGFTPDRRQIATAIDTLGLPQLVERSADPLRLILTATQRESLSRPSTGVSSRAGGAEERAAKNEEALVDTLETLTASSERADRTAQQNALRSMTRSLSDLARLMGEVEGRKYVVFLSEGFDASLIAGKGPALGTDTQAVHQATSDDRLLENTGGTGSDEEFGSTQAVNSVEKMLDEFRRADCQIQAVDIGGLRAGGEQGFERKNGKDALFNMAKSTGGELYENTNNINALMGQMLRRTGVTYVLSFQPEKIKTDGSFHRLKVELKGGPNTRGARVVHRPGFYAPRPLKEQPPMQRLLETANAVMSEESGSIAANVLATPFAAAGNLAQVPVVIEVDGPTLLAGKQGTQLPLEIYIYAMDSTGAVQDFVSQTVGLDLTKAEPVLRQTGLKFFGHMQLPAGDYSLRTLIRNAGTGNSSLQVTELKVPAFSGGQPALLPPVFQDAAPGRWVNLRQTKKEGQPDPPYLFLLKEQPYVPTARPGQQASVVLQGYNLGEGEWKAEAKVFSADGKEIPGAALQVVDKEAGSGSKPTRMVASFRPPNLPPGQYELRVTLTDGAGKSETTTSRFSVAGGAAGTRGGR